MSVRAAIAATLIAAATWSTACGDPPSKEMNQAQGAIDAARAAGAEEYAGEELQAAIDALRRAEEAVNQRDYRLALSHALDSRERAQNAARDAADGKARARSRAESLVAQVTTTLAAASGRLKQAEAARVPKKVLAGPQAEITAAQAALQEAGTALGREDYREAASVLNGHAARLRAVTATLDQALASRPARPGRVRR